MTTHKKNALKAIRDALIATIAFTIPQAVEALKLVDLGGYEHLLSVLLAALGFFLNRYYGIIHFNDKK